MHTFAIHNQNATETVSLFPKGSAARSEVIKISLCLVLQTIIMLGFLAGSLALGICLHPLYFALIPGILPIYLTLRIIFSQRIHAFYVACKVSPSAEEIRKALQPSFITNNL